MYTHYFSLTQAPFSIAPDPRYLFMSDRHREALAHLLFGIGSGGGFVLLTGEIGAGKTTVCRCFLEQIPENCELAYIFNPRLSVGEMLQSVCEEFHIALPATPATVKTYVDAINRYLLECHAQGRNNVLIIDEAQNLSADVLEQLRLLTNLETSERKLLQVILIGQPELRTMLARPELEQLAQRVIARYHLGSLSEPETGSYIAHRLAVAGAAGAAPFPAALTALVYRLTRGVPRRINLLCDRALLGAYVENTHQVTRSILRRAAAEVFAEPPAAAAPPRRRLALLAGTLMAGAAISAAAWQLLPRQPPAPVPAKAVAPAAMAVAPRGHASPEAALRELAGLWGQSLAPGQACASAPSHGLRCYQGRGGLYELRQLDRPAVLTLRDGARATHAVLVAMDDDTVTLSVDGAWQRVKVAALAARFDGTFTTFWKAPAAFRAQVPAGERGADVDWIAAQLGVSASGGAQSFDAAMQERLRAFQAANGLKDDGLAGPRTWIRLNQLGGVTEPRLLARSPKN